MYRTASAGVHVGVGPGHRFTVVDCALHEHLVRERGGVTRRGQRNRNSEAEGQVVDKLVRSR